MRLLIAGDTHGDTEFVADYLYPTAVNLGAAAIVQLGDFGYWEHAEDGVEFLDEVARTAKVYDTPLYFLRGNHDKVSLLLKKYAQTTVDGFIRLRPRVNYIPDGYAWTWAGVRFRSFGGAYSIDKQWRLDEEHKLHQKALYKESHRRKVGLASREVPSFAETLWFPEEQLTDEEFAALLSDDTGPKDIVLSHDKPRSSNPGLSLKDESECYPNQDNLQRALLLHKPKFWLHGHLHWRYSYPVRNDDLGGCTTVVGLAPNPPAALSFYKRHQSWCLLDLGPDQSIELTDGEIAETLHRTASGDG